MRGLLRDKRVLITGAARGIGLAIARAASAEGAQVALADIDAEPLNEAAEALGGAAAGVLALPMDVSAPASIAEGVAVLREAWGGLDGLVNNAAILDESHTESVSLPRFERVLQVNAVSVLAVSQAALPLLEGRPSSAIVNTLSTQAFFGQANAVAYAAAKGAGLQLTRAMAVDLAPKGIRVNAVAPGFIDTRMAVMASGAHEHETDWFRAIYVGARKIPLARAGTPADCAGAFLFLLSELSAYVTGHTIFVDGGLCATY